MKEMSDWLSVFQAEIDKITRSNNLHNTAVVWGQKVDSPNKRVTVEEGSIEMGCHGTRVVASGSELA